MDTNTKLKKCGKCLKTYYCSPTCQAEDWNSHKKVCVAPVDDECPICLDPIHATKNRTTTECGHCFHSSCLIKHSVLTNLGCPLCRNALADIPEEEEEEEEDYATTVDESDEDDDSIEEPPLPISQRRTITHILAEMKRRNITDRQLVSALISITFQQSWMDRFFILNPADDKEEQVMDVLDNISLIAVDHRDTRRYADVLNNAPAVSEAGIGPTNL
jgi:hypothetical protein